MSWFHKNTSMWLRPEQFRPFASYSLLTGIRTVIAFVCGCMGKQYSFEVHKVCRGLLQECGLRSPGSFPGPARISRHQIQRGRSRDGGCAGHAGHAADSVSRSVALAAANPPGSVPKPPPPHPRGAGVTSARKSVIGWGGGEGGRRGRGFPQIQLRREEKRGTKKKNAWWEKQM